MVASGAAQSDLFQTNKKETSKGNITKEDPKLTETEEEESTDDEIK